MTTGGAQAIKDDVSGPLSYIPLTAYPQRSGFCVQAEPGRGKAQVLCEARRNSMGETSQIRKSLWLQDPRAHKTMGGYPA